MLGIQVYSRILSLLIGSLVIAAEAGRIESSTGGGSLPEQEIGKNDLISVSVYDAPELSRAARVNGSGEIRLPLLRRAISIEGLMPAIAAKRIGEALIEERVLVEPVVTVTVLEYHSRPVTVVGAVRAPTTFQAAGRVTLLDALTKAGGLTELAGPEILVRGLRAEPETRRVPVKALIDDANADLNYVLRGGEEIAVPASRSVYVVGSVRKPGAVPVRGGADTSLLQVLAMTEGLAPFANKRAYLYRQDGNGGKQEIAIDLDRILRRQKPDVHLQGDDILYIPDNRGKRISLAAMERLLAFGSTAGATALVYSGMR